MPFDAHANFAYSLVAVAPVPALSGTTLTVAAGTGTLFPATPFNCTVWPSGFAPLSTNAEIVRVTNIAGDVFTISRAQEGTSAKPIGAGYQIANTITAKVIQDVESAIGGAITGINVSAGASSSNVSSLVFSNSNGVSFGYDGTNVTATVATNYQSQGPYLTTAQPPGPYLTTAGLSQDSSKYAGTTAGIAGGSLTVNTAGISISLPSYLTTAMASNRGSDFVQANAVFAGTNASGTIASNGISVSVAAPTAGGITNVKISAGTLSNNLSALTFGDSNGVSWGLNTNSVLTATVKTDYQTSGAYLTTAGRSQDSSKYAGTSTGITGGSVTLDTSGIAINLPAYLTTAMASNAATISNVNVSAGTTSTNASAFTLSNSNGVSFGIGSGASAGVVTATVATNYQSQGAYLTTAMQSNAATISNVKISAGASSSNVSAVTFSNSNGVSFGYDGTAITATVVTNYQSAGAYLTTAALSQDSSKYAGTSTGMTGGSVTLNTSGIAINLPAYLTTADLSQNSSNYAGVGETVGTTAGTDLALTVNTAGVSIAYPKWITTAQSPGAYLTTAALSQDSSKYAGTSTGMTGGSVTLNTSGIAINLPAYLTTAGLSADSSKYAGTSTGMTGGSVTLNTSGIAINLPAYLTTAALSADSSKYAGTSTGMTGGSVTLNTSGIAINLPAYLTTAALSADSSKYAGTSTGMTGGSVTLNTSGIAINLPVYLTTARASTDAIGLNTAGTNMTWTANSSGLSINAGGYAGTVTGATNVLVTANSSGVSVSAPNIFEFNPPWIFQGMNTTSSLGQNTQYFQPFDLPIAMTAAYIGFYISLSLSLSAGNSTGTCAVGAGYALYTRNMTNGAASNTLSLLTSYNMTILSASMTSNTAFRATHFIGTSGASSHSTSQYAVSNASVTNYISTTICGLRPVYFPISSLMTPGRYWLGFWVSSVSGNAMTNNVSVLNTTVGPIPAMAAWGAASNATNASLYMQQQGWGSFSAVQSTWPNSIAWTSDTIRQGASGTLIPFRIAGYNTNASQI